MKNKLCPNRVACHDYGNNNCDGCAVGKKITSLQRKNKTLLSMIETDRAEKEALAEKYQALMASAINDNDPELGHSNCDRLLCELLMELGYDGVVKAYEEQTRYFS